MTLEVWYLVLGAMLMVIALTPSALKRWPLTAAMLYLGLGVVLGPLALAVATVHPVDHAEMLERAAELVVIVSLFTAGLKLRTPFAKGQWNIPVRLAFISMTLTVGMVALVGLFGLGLPIGAAVLLGAVLAPTDPVLASEVQLESATDRNQIRFTLTGEAGMNDGTAFPFVMLGLGLLGLHELGAWGWRWFAVDVVWAIGGGFAIGAVFGYTAGRTVLHLRREHREGLGRDEFLALGLIGLSYGTALVAGTYGFLAVFGAGLALRTVERRQTTDSPAKRSSAPASGQREIHPQTAPAHLTESVLGFNEQLERILEVALVILIGAMLTPDFLNIADLWLVPVLILVIRPLAVVLGLAGVGVPVAQVSLLSWFGIRGVGSIYYLMHGIGFGVAPDIAERLISITLWVIAVSVVIHGMSATPLMRWHESRREKQTADPAGS